MVRSLLASVAAIALMTGAAYAQDSNTTYYSRTITNSTPFGASRTTTVTTSQARVVEEDVDAEAPPPAPLADAPPPPPRAYDEQSADIGDPPPPSDEAPIYRRETTTRQINPDGSAMNRTDTVQKRQTFYDNDQQLSAHSTTETHSNIVTYGPPVVYAPNAGAAGPSPVVVLPPDQYRTTTTTIRHDEE